MLDSLEKLVSEVGELHSKLILLAGGPQSNKSALLDAWGASGISHRCASMYPVELGLWFGDLP